MPRIRRGFPVIRPGTARLHPKGTSSRFALRAPRRLAPHNDTSGGAAVHQRPPAVELSRTWRSGSAATVKSVSTHVRRCPVHLGRPLLRLPRRFAPRNDKSGAITVLTGACTSRQRCAGSGMPLPYNSGCGRRNCFKICNCQWRSGSAATDAIGLCVFSVARANCKCLPEIATAPSGPRNDTSGECGGDQSTSAVEYLCTRRSLPVKGTPHP